MTKDVQKYFDEESSSYERIRWRGNFVSRYDFKVTREALTSLMDKTEAFLDMGCGPGTWLEEYSKHYGMGVGVDLSKKMLQICKRKRLPNVSLILADCHRLPFRERVFDTILSSRVFIYLNLETALNETKRVLKNNGNFILLIQIERRSLYFKLREYLRKSEKFLENANYLTAHDLIMRVSKHFQVCQTKGVIFHEHISQNALTLCPTAFLLNYLYLKLLYVLEKYFSTSFLKYFYASSIAIKLRKASSNTQRAMAGLTPLVS